jgi:hypothetical protein
MLVIVRKGEWELIRSPQTIPEAWDLADRLTEQTGIPHWVNKA